MKPGKLITDFFKPIPLEDIVYTTDWDVDNTAQEIITLLKKWGYQPTCLQDIVNTIRSNFQAVFSSRNLIKKQTTTTFQVFDKVHNYFGNTIDRGFVNTITHKLCEQNYYFITKDNDNYIPLPMELFE